MESVPGVPGHAGAALSAQLLASDGGALVAKVNPFYRVPRNPCDRIESTYGVGNNLLKNSWLGFYASIWPSYQALNAFLLTSLLPGQARCMRDFEATLTAIDDNYWAHGLAGLPAAYDQGPAPLHFPGDLPRVDDSMWMGVSLMQAYDRTGSESFLRRAEAVFALARANWDPLRGGIYWEYHAPGATNLEKAVASNAPAAAVALGIYRATGNPMYLRWGEKIVRWLHSHLMDRRTGLYDDHVIDSRLPPVIGHAKYTYNQGIMVGVLAMLSTVSPGTYPLTDAVSLARRAMEYFRSHRSYRNPGFDLVWAQNLLWTAGLYHQASFTAEARASLRAAIRAEPRNPGSLLEFASGIGLRALFELPPKDYGLLAP